MTALLIFGIVALICVIGLTFFIALKLSETIHRAFQTVETMQAGYQQHLDRTLDRLMTIRWEDFVTVRDLEEAEDVGGFFAPGEQDDGEVTVEAPNFLGRMRPLPDVGAADEHEEQLLREDFGP
ncbi:MAG: hypothetical protein EHM23_25200 [Acidobacteria bacterium]|jgi:hypothetical protein|nr:MAG: hypothetical protein EHM23_25200 [Acidobacteriota bacterium]